MPCIQIWNRSLQKYERPVDSVTRMTYREMRSQADGPGLKHAQAKRKLNEFGANQIEFKPDSLRKLIRREFSSWYYLYQYITFSVWIWDSYLFVGVVMALIVFGSAAASIFVMWRNEKSIAQLSKHESVAQVRRDNEWIEVDSKDLVPGDTVRVQAGWVLPCDLVIVRGSVVMNESCLTGEAAPVFKTAPPHNSDEIPKQSMNAKHVLMASTTVLETPNDSAVAVVLATGMDTSKGEILASILYPQQMIFKYDEELIAVSLLLLCYSFFCFGLSIYLQSHNGSKSSSLTKLWYGVFTVSQVLSPLVPVALKVGQVRSCKRLLDNDIFCINPARIPISGKVRVLCKS